ncbi:hypothetical protein D9619_006185 [Psilocybe cf. subviscida]|uniref:F-box domain-containing protein n=1 Tax=Psilocybe cf. subviscida TaxID=2480587 RepID=A0A8H5B414_9AGAR|nr:hypothetical protein D9619_006185 [Psilocybe cf. subviscida]
MLVRNRSPKRSPTPTASRRSESDGPPVSTLPLEVLVQIFEVLVHDYCRHLYCWVPEVTHVCSYWRELAINTPSLWTAIPTSNVYNILNPNWTRICLDRAKTHPVKVNLVHTDWKKNLAVLKHLSHIGSLHIEMHAEELDDIAYILSLVGDEAKDLKELVIRGFTDDDRQFELPPTLFHGASKLEILELLYIFIDWSMPLLQNLTCLTLHALSRKNAPSWTQLLATLDRMPGLVTLVLNLAHPLGYPPEDLAPIHLPHLENLTLGCYHAPNATAFLRRVTFPPLVKLIISCGGHSKANYLHCLRAMARLLPITFPGDFSHLIINWDHRPIITNQGVRFRLRSHHSEPETPVDIDLACTPQASIETVIEHVLEGLLLRSTLTCLSINGCNSPTISATAFRQLFGQIPELHTIEVEDPTSVACNLILALSIPINHPPGATLDFPSLQYLSLGAVDLDYNNRNCSDLEDALMQRYEYGAEILCLNVTGCYMLSEKTVQRFAGILHDVIWDGVVLETRSY